MRVTARLADAEAGVRRGVVFWDVISHCTFFDQLQNIADWASVLC